MVNFSELFNVNATTLPMDKKSLSSMMNRATLVGYYQCAYSSLISTLKMIQGAPELSVSLNPQWLWNNANNPTNKLECIIQIEGIQTYSEFVDKVVKNDDAKEWTDFLTYSPEFRDEIKDLKTRAFKKFLWNYDNINNWINDNNVGVIKAGKNQLALDFDYFKQQILDTTDYESFIKSANKEQIQRAIEYMTREGCAKLKKYQNELNLHIKNNNKREENLVLKNPIIRKIYILSGLQNQCKNDFPKIKFEVLDKKEPEIVLNKESQKMLQRVKDEK